MWETQNEVSSLSSRYIMFLGENKKTLKKLPSYNVIDPERTQKHNALGFAMFGEIFT